MDDDDTGPQPDIKLAQGEALPIRLSAAFDEVSDEWVGVPLEDVDSYYRNIPVSLLTTSYKYFHCLSINSIVNLLNIFSPDVHNNHKEKGDIPVQRDRGDVLLESL